MRCQKYPKSGQDAAFQTLHLLLKFRRLLLAISVLVFHFHETQPPTPIRPVGHLRGLKFRGTSQAQHNFFSSSANPRRLQPIWPLAALLWDRIHARTLSFWQMTLKVSEDVFQTEKQQFESSALAKYVQERDVHLTPSSKYQS